MRAALWIGLLTALTGCGMLAVKGQQATIDALCVISGHVEAEANVPAPLIVVLARQTGTDPGRRESWTIADHFILEGPGQWQFRASAGSYGLLAFQDLNRDLKAQPGEPYLRLDPDRLFSCAPGERRTDLTLLIPAGGRSRLDETIDISALQVRSFGDQLELSLGQMTAFGEIATLSDARFGPAVAEDGLWRPFDFLIKGGPGVYFLEPYDSSKTPVLFVHGINGTPQNFRTLIDRLDRTRFQPWVYYYPSGGSLSMVADHLTQTMRTLRLRHGFRSFVVVAHSMGGLVSRGFLLRYREGGGGAAVPLFVTIATPWDGHKAAEMGTKSPVVVRVWTDMAPGSQYLRSLYARDPNVPHHLLFSFRQGGLSLGEANDGTVTVASQLRPEAQQGALRIEGFNETHMSVLESAAVSERLNELLGQLK
jgi:pimeloyl-ACP methyl ester carboxylesterase